MKRLLIIFISIVSLPGIGQELDSLLLDEVVFAVPKFTKYSAGAKVVSLKKSNQPTSLNDVLSKLPSITFKNYGNGGLSTIAFRGTSASHTQLLWNGIPVNSPTLGQSDFSLFPTFMMDEISVQYGSTSALTGSGAIGGAVSMTNANPTFIKQTNVNTTLRYGSFGRVFTGVKSNYGNKKIQGKTKVYRRSVRNDFPYPEKGSNRILRQNNAAIKSYGVEQQLQTKLSKTQQLSIAGFYNFNRREVQPNVTSTGNGETLQDKNTRLIASYTNYSKVGFWEAKAGYIFDDQLSNDTIRLRSEQWSYVLNWDKDIGHNLNLRTGVNHHRIIPKTESHIVNAREDRTEIYTSVKRQFNKRWKASLNLRQALYDGELVPFTPSFGQEYSIELGQSKLLLKNRIGRGYRIPTLNDRYWAKGGNPDIKPEKSWSLEIGWQWLKNIKKSSLSVEFTAYHQSVKDWIQWTQKGSGIWTPENIQEGEIKGVELITKLMFKQGKHSFSIDANYSLTRSIIKQDVDEDFINNFLPYVAQHNSYFMLSWKVSKWSNTLSANYTGKLFIEKTNSELQSIDGFVLIDYRLSRNLIVQKINLQLSAEVNNILNIYYEQLKNRAMPGRNYSINLSINI